MKAPVIIAMSGKKGSGKDTLAPVIRDYFSDKWYKGNRSVDFCLICAFADLLKTFCIDVLGLKYEQCYGGDEEKNTLTKYRWSDVKNKEHTEDLILRSSDDEFMTGREVMQIFGTECVRYWFGNVWAEATLRYIKKAAPALAIITDNRFPSEVDTILGHPKGHVIRLTRNPHKNDHHASEVSLDSFDWNRDRCHVLDNASLSREEQIEHIIPILDHIFHQEFGR